MESRPLLRFGPFTLDGEAEELRRAGTLLRLPPQPLRILLLLAQRPGEIVTREEIHAAIWGAETYVDFEHGINTAIRQIRAALRDQAESPRYVRTIPRRGYSFVAQVERIARPEATPMIATSALPPPFVPPSLALPALSASPLASSSAPRSSAAPTRNPIAPRIAAIAAAAILAATAMLAVIVRSRPAPRDKAKSVAVLPFRRLGPPIAGVDERSFAEELRAILGRLPHSYVAVLDNHAVAGADVVIDGTVRQSDDGVRVLVSVTDAATKTQLWNETVQRPADRKEGIAVEVAHRVMHDVAGRFLPPPRNEPPLVTRAAPAAIALYRRARQMHSGSQPFDWLRTKELYEAAIRIEPRFAEAWSGLADLWGTQALRGSMADCDRAAARATECARRALALQPRNAEAHGALGVLAGQRDYDLAAADESLRRAIAAQPDYVDAHANLALVSAMRGQADESLRQYAAAQQLDPVGLDTSPGEALLYLYARRYEDARAAYREILAVNPESKAAAWGLLSTYILERNWSEATAVAAALRGVSAEGVPRTQKGFLAFYCGFEDFLREGRKQERFNDYFLAVFYAQLGDRDRSFELLNQAIDLHTPAVSYIMVDPRLDNLRGDPRFRAALARLKLGRPPDGTAG